MDDYEQHRSRQLREAQREFDEWLRTLPADQREEMAKLRPHDDSATSGPAFPDDPASYATCATPTFEEDPIDELAEKFNIDRDTAELIEKWHSEKLRDEQIATLANTLQTIIGALLSSKNPKMAAASLAFAAGLHTLNDIRSQSEYGKQLGLTRAAVNKSVQHWKKILNLKSSVFTKTDSAHQKLIESNSKQTHWRKQSASAANILNALKKKI